MKASHGLLALSLLGFLGCSNSETERLQRENSELRAKLQALQAQVDGLSAENSRLKETDQNYFSVAIEALRAARSPEDLQKALQLFQRVKAHFPSSPLISKVEAHERDVQGRLARYEETQRRTAAFQAALTAHAFDRASEELEALQPLLSAADGEALKKRLLDERERPLSTTINRLITEYSRINSSLDIEAFHRAVGQRVTFPATLASIDRKQMSVNAYSEGWLQGSSVDVFYQGTNLESWLTDNDPKCCENRYQVVGRVSLYSNTGSPYVKAESITPLK